MSVDQSQEYIQHYDELYKYPSIKLGRSSTYIYAIAQARLHDLGFRKELAPRTILITDISYYDHLNDNLHIIEIVNHFGGSVSLHPTCEVSQSALNEIELEIFGS